MTLSPKQNPNMPRSSRWILAGLLVTIFLVAAGMVSIAAARERVTDTGRLDELSLELARQSAAGRTPLFQSLLRAEHGPAGQLNREPGLSLMGIDVRGFPRYYAVVNHDAAVSIATEPLLPGGASGLSLTGANSLGDLAVWDAASALVTHQEFGGRVVVADASTETHPHSTHVAGTMVAMGLDASARGMSPGGQLASFDWSDDESEMASAAATGMLVSNHSYGSVTGWYRQGSEPYAFYWFGDVEIDANEDPGFGFYSNGTASWDEIAYNAPNYLIVKSAGNDRNDTGPTGGEPHYYWDAGAGEYLESYDYRAPDGGATGFDTVSYKGVAKNILTVAAVGDVVGGYQGSGSVVMSSFSGWGPTDDGRIKPDISANGIGLYSCMDDSIDAYASYSGTSMASPSVAGSANLLNQYYRSLGDGTPLAAASLKALLIHTADEAGADTGPDYGFGWGLANISAAADLVTASAGAENPIHELMLADGEIDTLEFYCDGLSPIVLTTVWTDPVGTPPVWSLDPPDLMLVNDLDMRLIRVSDASVYTPWILDPANPATAATTGDNFRDNVEKIEVAAPQAGDYLVTISHKGSVGSGQDYSLIRSGLSLAAPVAPTVGNVVFAQRTDGSGLVDVGYDLVDPDSPTVSVVLQASADGGLSWDLAVSSVSGDVGALVPVGIARALVWDFAGDHPGLFGTNFQVRVIASDGP